MQNVLGVTDPLQQLWAKASDRARGVMFLANEQARRLNHEFLGTEHILLGLVEEKNGVGARILESLGVDLKGISQKIHELIKPGPDTARALDNLTLTPRAKQVLESAVDGNRGISCEHIGTGHLLLGLIRESDDVVGQILGSLGVSYGDVRSMVAGWDRTERKEEIPLAERMRPLCEELGEHLQAAINVLFRLRRLQAQFMPPEK